VIAASRVVNGLIECVTLPELLAQRFSGKYIGDACTPILLVIRRNRDRRPRERLVRWEGVCANWKTDKMNKDSTARRSERVDDKPTTAPLQMPPRWPLRLPSVLSAPILDIRLL
jgi:hypothetical protein